MRSTSKHHQIVQSNITTGINLYTTATVDWLLTGQQCYTILCIINLQVGKYTQIVPKILIKQNHQQGLSYYYSLSRDKKDSLIFLVL